MERAESNYYYFFLEQKHNELLKEDITSKMMHYINFTKSKLEFGAFFVRVNRVNYSNSQNRRRLQLEKPSLIKHFDETSFILNEEFMAVVNICVEFWKQTYKLSRRIVRLMKLRNLSIWSELIVIRERAISKFDSTDTYVIFFIWRDLLYYSYCNAIIILMSVEKRKIARFWNLAKNEQKKKVNRPNARIVITKERE